MILSYPIQLDGREVAKVEFITTTPEAHSRFSQKTAEVNWLLLLHIAQLREAFQKEYGHEDE